MVLKIDLFQKVETVVESPLKVVVFHEGFTPRQVDLLKQQALKVEKGQVSHGKFLLTIHDMGSSEI